MWQLKHLLFQLCIDKRKCMLSIQNSCCSFKLWYQLPAVALTNATLISIATLKNSFPMAAFNCSTGPLCGINPPVLISDVNRNWLFKWIVGVSFISYLHPALLFLNFILRYIRLFWQIPSNELKHHWCIQNVWKTCIMIWCCNQHCVC